MNAIEIIIRTGERNTSDEGEVAWKNSTNDTILVSYTHDEYSAKLEALAQAASLLRQPTLDFSSIFEGISSNLPGRDTS